MTTQSKAWKFIGGIGLIVCGVVFLVISALTSMVGFVWDDIVLIPLGASLLVIGSKDIKEAIGW